MTSTTETSLYKVEEFLSFYKLEKKNFHFIAKYDIIIFNVCHLKIYTKMEEKATLSLFLLTF